MLAPLTIAVSLHKTQAETCTTAVPTPHFLSSYNFFKHVHRVARQLLTQTVGLCQAVALLA